MAIQGTIIVDTLVMKSKADEVRTLGNKVKQEFQTMSDLISKTSSYWIGEAGDLHRKLYNDHKDDIDQMIRRILEHPTDLEAMAGNYETAENTNVNTAQLLNADIID